jgi:hypothetical protein
MKVLRIKRIMDMGSNSSRSGLRVREPPGPQFPPCQPLLAIPAKEIEAKNFFIFMYFHGQSAAQPHGWLVRMENGKVRGFHLVYWHPVALEACSSYRRFSGRERREKRLND